ncbi:MAG: TRAP transporter substrate-binding protein [Synergistaceae bacterium]|jgi:tripartite ATP-independent transporter DctP family solute receptor|nr:TRAP transporter substrate-binding protein [Synergistaceae bacterium]
MKKLGLILSFALLFVVTLSCVSPVWGAPIVMRLANVTPSGDPRDIASLKLAELVEKKTNGAAKIEVFSGGTLGDWRVTIEGLKPGIVNIVIESVGTIEPYTKYAAVDPFPYLYRDIEHFRKVWYSDTGASLLDRIGRDGGFKLLGAQYRGARYVTSKKKFTNLDELKGLKIRAPQLKMYLRTWELLGAAPTPMAATEIYTGLQQGTVDAQENPLDYDYSNAFYEVCPFLIETRHVFSNDVFIIDLAYFDNLPKEIQDALVEAANEVGAWRTNFSTEQEAEYVKKFQEKGVEVVPIDTAPMREKVKDIIDSFPDLKEIVAEIQGVK